MSTPRTPRSPRLLLDINGVFYLVEAATATFPVTAWRLTKPIDRTSYVVRLDDTGHHCSCPWATWHPEGRCKHVIALVGVDLLPVTVPFRVRPDMPKAGPEHGLTGEEEGGAS